MRSNETRSRGSQHTRATQPLALIALVLTTFGNCLTGRFVLDDHFLIERNPNVRSLAGVATAFRTDVKHFAAPAASRPSRPAYYRPLSLSSFVVDYALWRNNAGLYHIQNILWHVVNVILVYHLGLCLLTSRWASF